MLFVKTKYSWEGIRNLKQERMNINILLNYEVGLKFVIVLSFLLLAFIYCPSLWIVFCCFSVTDFSLDSITVKEHNVYNLNYFVILRFALYPKI